MCLTACGPKVVTKSVPVTPPAQLIQDCPITDVPLKTTGDLIIALRQAYVDIANCNADKKALREWDREVHGK